MEFPVQGEEDDDEDEKMESAPDGKEVKPEPTEVKDEDEQPTSPLPSTADDSPQTPASNKASISIDFGTPLLKFSPYDALPPGENFMVGVSDVINFENLPDSTGSYEKMEKIIKKVRHEVKRLNSC